MLVRRPVSQCVRRSPAELVRNNLALLLLPGPQPAQLPPIVLLLPRVLLCLLEEIAAQFLELFPAAVGR